MRRLEHARLTAFHPPAHRIRTLLTYRTLVFMHALPFLRHLSILNAHICGGRTWDEDMTGICRIQFWRRLQCLPLFVRQNVNIW